MRGTAFEQRLHGFHYFSYNVNEALHTTEGEKQLLWQLMGMIRRFIQHRQPSPQTDRILQVSGLTATQAADSLGFEYSQHFTRFFKKHTGLLPSKYIASLKK